MRSIACYLLVILAASPRFAEAAPSDLGSYAMLKFTDSMAHLGKRLSSSSKNLLEMSAVLTGPDREAVNQVVNSATETNYLAQGITDLSLVVGGMKCEEDAKAAGIVFRYESRNIYQTVQLSLQIVNMALPRISQPAVSAEAMQVRDMLNEFENLIAPYAHE